MKAHADLREKDCASFFPVHDAHAVLDDGAVLPQSIDCTPQGAAGRHNVLDKKDPVPRLQIALEIALRPMLLQRLAHHHVGLAAREAHGCGDWDSTELDACNSIRLLRVWPHELCYSVKDRWASDCLLQVHVIIGVFPGRQSKGTVTQRL